MKKLLLAAMLAGAAFGAPVQAATQLFVVSYGNGVIKVPMFDPTLGTLNGAKLMITGHLDYPFLDMTREPAAGPFSYSAFYSFYYLGTYLDIGVSGSGTADFGAGPILYLGADGSKSGLIPDSRHPFIQGVGTWSGAISIDPPWTVTPDDGSIVPVTDESSPYFVSGELTVVYDYNAVPEPASWGLMIAGFALAGGQMRRRRAALLVA